MSPLYNYLGYYSCTFVLTKYISMLRFIILAVICGGLALHSCAQSPHGGAFTVLENTWSGEYGKGTFTETWEVIDQWTLEGWGYYIVESDTVMREYLQIRKTGDHWGYLASINGSPPVLFNLKKVDGQSWVFANPEHDFPQEIHYIINSDGTLEVKASGIMNGTNTVDRYLLKPLN